MAPKWYFAPTPANNMTQVQQVLKNLPGMLQNLKWQHVGYAFNYEGKENLTAHLPMQVIPATEENRAQAVESFRTAGIEKSAAEQFVNMILEFEKPREISPLEGIAWDAPDMTPPNTP